MKILGKQDSEGCIFLHIIINVIITFACDVWVRTFLHQFLGGAPTSICHFFCPSIRRSHSISQELIIILGTHVYIDDAPKPFLFFLILIFQAIKRTKNSPKWQKFMSVSLSISGTVHHMIFGTHVWNYISSNLFFNFSKFWFIRFLGE